MKAHTTAYIPKYCWVGDKQKVVYESLEAAEGWCQVVEAERDLPPGSLTAYKCEYGEHWHLASRGAKTKPVAT